MTKQYAACIVAVFALLTAACSSRHEHHDDHQATEGDSVAAAGKETWAEMDEFHTIMAESFHPYKDSANLSPAKANAAAMEAAAKKWLDAPRPEKVDTDETKAKLEHLYQGATAFVETVKSGDDKVIGDSLTKLHDLFHELQESWYAGGPGDHHEHH